MTIKMREKLKNSLQQESKIGVNSGDMVDIPNTIEEELELSKEQQELIDLHEYLFSVDPEGAPAVSVLEAWKYKHKSLFVSKISSDSEQPYVFTTLKRKDFKLLQGQGVFENEEKGNEVLVEYCLLYPAPSQSWRLISDAGIITTLGKQIAYKSGFVPQQEALSLIKIV